MRNRRIGRKLGMVTKHRNAMLRNMVTDLFRLGSIKTTDMKAKELRRFAEKLITTAKKGNLQARRMAAAVLRDKDVVRKLFDDIAPHFKERPGGYTRIVKLGMRRGDNAPISHIELVEEEFKPKKAKKKRKPAKKAAAKAESAAVGEESAAVVGEEGAQSPKKQAAEDLGVTEEKVKAKPAAKPKAKKAEPKTEPDSPEDPEDKEDKEGK